ncbi:HAT family dimerization domain-containing protein [Zostera marina]|uniref:HAT family dimerization domain-containing protein n=1 Tax=Zostera marina TaxID=29655 RepID=A0A0K9PA06_ZOSMR|nr:HAT family dimerization domain-containing protein [Zostera marina]
MESEAIHSYSMEGISDTEMAIVEATPIPTPAPKKRKKKSFVWDYFTVENVSEDCSRACCNQCKQSYAYSTGNKIAGTSHLKRHILMGICPKIREENQQRALISGSSVGASIDPPKRRYRSSAIYSHPFDQDNSCINLAKMIIMHEYPLNMVEHSSFATFSQGLQPKFKMPDLDAIETEVMAIHHKEKQNISILFGTMPGRVSLTIGLYTTSQTLGYVSLTGHFIGNDWRLHKRMLNFMMVSSPHSENALSDAIGYCLSEWNMKSKLFTITLDNNCSSHDIYSANLRDHLSNKNALMLKGKLFVVRCFAHVLNVVAQDVIASIHGIIYNIRESVKYVKATIEREGKFVDISEQHQIPSSKSLSLDVQMQWNTTYLMLVAALDFRHAFTSLEACDPDYNEAPTIADWKKVEIVCTYLKLLYDSANTIMGTVDPTSNIYFQEAWKIQLELANALQGEDPVVCEIAKDMHEKFDQYWKDCSFILAIAVVMDPRFKMKLVEFSFSKIYGEDSARYIKVVDDAIHELYREYAINPHSLNPSYTEHEQNRQFNSVEASSIIVRSNGEACDFGEDHNFDVSINIEETHTQNIGETHAHNIEETQNIGEVYMVEQNNGEVNFVLEPNNGHSGHIEQELAIVQVKGEPDDGNYNHMNRMPLALSTGDGLLDFDIYISETAVADQTKSELDQYLEESLVPRIQEFDILGWWKLNVLKYPTLCKMASDILAIPMSMLSSFSTGSGNKMLDEYRSSLRPDTVEALFCTKDWLQYGPAMQEPPSSNGLFKPEL